MRIATACGKLPGPTYPHLTRGLPSPLHDVADLAHAPCVCLGHALAVRAAVAIGEKAIAGRLQDRSLFGVGGTDCTLILRGHVDVERCEAAIRAHGDLP